MKKVDKNEYANFRNLFSELDWELSGEAVIAGNNPGVILTSEGSNDAALMGSPEGWLLVGNQKNHKFCTDLRKWLETKFEEWAENTDAEDFEIYFLPRWEAASKVIFQSKPLMRYPRRHYICQKQDWKKEAVKLSEDMKLNYLNSLLVTKLSSYRNINHIKEWIINNWGTYENFDKNGFAVAVIKDDVIVSWSVADCRFEDKCEIGIHTDDQFRRQGLASYTVTSMLEHAFDNGFTQVGWHCADDNKGSWRTAERCGFHLNKDYYGYYCHL